MCGICGELRFDGQPASASAVQKMARAMASRGPHGEGLFLRGSQALGQRRLKIIDLSEASGQPMTDSQLGLSITFNGAIYNYRELRAELEAKGYQFFSQGDTEVILKAYHAWGEDCVQRLSGMFAFAIVERDSQRAFLARDRLGIKPLYLAERPGHLRFASTLPALRAAGDLDTSIDTTALHHYFSFHAIVPPPRTLLRGVRKLPPATTLRIEPDGAKTCSTYWEPVFDSSPEQRRMTRDDWMNAMGQALETAVRRRLVADVPVGVLLSGGLDSSLITGLLAKAGESLSTFSIGFETVGDTQGDEFEYSDVIAREFATDHHKMTISSEEVLEHLLPCIDAMSEPMVSHDVIGFYLLSREVSKHVRVVQSGQGADEVFAGYFWYPPLQDSTDPVEDYCSRFLDREQPALARLLERDFVVDNASRKLVEEHFAKPGASDPVDKALRLDQQVMLVDDPVKRVDNMTMAFGLEARVPFLDHDLVELAAAMPAELKLPDGGKHLLKEYARKVIPAHVIDRPKGYFPVPPLKYLRGPFLEMAKDALTSVKARQRGLFKHKEVEVLLAMPDQHITSLGGSELWQAALLELWFDRHGL